MSEDRRPNVAGQPVREPAAPEPDAGSAELEREARLLRDRAGADGHEPAGTRPDEQPGPRTGGEG
jgi:hypothetical protein